MNYATQKKEEEKPRVLLGRPQQREGRVVGCRTGKSTTFNMMCKMSVPAEGFPFCTIGPTGACRCPTAVHRVHRRSPKSEVPAFLTVFDIAGLVKGASEGAGLGNAFLSHISATDALFHICRTYEETADGDAATHVEDTVDPVRDLEIIANELLQKDIAFVESQRGPLAKEVGATARRRTRRTSWRDRQDPEWKQKDARLARWSSRRSTCSTSTTCSRRSRRSTW